MNNGECKNLKKIDVYDFEKYINKSLTEQKLKCNIGSWAFIKGDKGIILVETDSCHYIYKNLDEKLEFSLYDIIEGDSFNIIPSRYGKLSLKSLLSNSEHTSKLLDEFVDFFGSRKKSNFNILLDSIKEIGLNPEEFTNIKL